MREKLRPLLRKVLTSLTTKALFKHKPKIVAIVGNGETSTARELIFHVLNSTYPASRNLETPEAEFSVPLSVLGYEHYPTTYFEWLWALAVISIQLTFTKSHFHFLILELDTVNRELQRYWSGILNPTITVVTGSTQKLVLPTKEFDVPTKENLDSNYINLAAAVGEYFEIEKEIGEVIASTVSFPEARIRILKGKNSSVIVDATHYYFPISIKSVVELIEPIGRKAIFTNNPHDLEYLKLHELQQIQVNPTNFEPEPGTTIILRGLRTRALREFKDLVDSRPK